MVANEHVLFLEIISLVFWLATILIAPLFFQFRCILPFLDSIYSFYKLSSFLLTLSSFVINVLPFKLFGNNCNARSFNPLLFPVSLLFYFNCIQLQIIAINTPCSLLSAALSLAEKRPFANWYPFVTMHLFEILNDVAWTKVLVESQETADFWYRLFIVCNITKLWNSIQHVLSSSFVW